MRRLFQPQKICLELGRGKCFLSFFFLCLGFFTNPFHGVLAFRVGTARCSFFWVFLYRYHAATAATDFSMGFLVVGGFCEGEWGSVECHILCIMCGDIIGDIFETFSLLVDWIVMFVIVVNSACRE